MAQSKLHFMLDVFTRYLLTGRRKPFLASYKLTYRCNLRCRQCPFVDYAAPDPSFEQVCHCLDRLHERGDRVVVLEGGEPLLWRDGEYRVRDVVGYARQKFTCVGLTTNGTLPLDVESDVLWVSLDGFAETHHRLRQADIFDQVIDNILNSSHPRLFAHITANAINHLEVPELVRFLSEHVKGITIQFYYPYGDDDALFLPFPQRIALLERLIELKRAGYPVLNSVASLRALQHNTWRCLPWRIDSADPDGTIRQGCYLLGRAKIDCARCGFSPYTELSLAFRGNLQAIQAGLRIFG